MKNANILFTALSVLTLFACGKDGKSKSAPSIFHAIDSAEGVCSESTDINAIVDDPSDAVSGSCPTTLDGAKLVAGCRYSQYTAWLYENETNTLSYVKSGCAYESDEYESGTFLTPSQK